LRKKNKGKILNARRRVQSAKRQIVFRVFFAGGIYENR